MKYYMLLTTNEVLCKHSTRPTCSMVVPEAHANIDGSSFNRNGAVERGNGRGKDVTCLRPKENKST
jgi:hypothetical protein